MIKKSRLVGFLVCVCLVLLLSGCFARPQNVVLMIGDGMGFEHVKAAGMYANGEEGSFVFETFPYRTAMTTHSADEAITDSAASGTAMATGKKVNNGVISVAIPGDGRELKTMLEHFKDYGKSLGLVTTVPITHATPAAFGAHEQSRGNSNEIARDYLNQTRPNVLFGGGKNGLTAKLAKQAGYMVVENVDELKKLDTEKACYVSGQFASEIPYESEGVGMLPHLAQMVEVAIKILDNDPDGFFVMIEGGKIDWAGHKNDLERNVGETIEFARSVKVVYDWAKERGDTLIVVTSDHETGGLKVLENNGKGKLPKVSWSSRGHTAAKVPVYAWGLGAERFQGKMDNTDIFEKIVEMIGIYEMNAIRE